MKTAQGLGSAGVREDRRKHPRLKIPLEVEYQLEGDRLCQQATLIDLSAGGVAIITDDPLPTGGNLAFVRFKLAADGDAAAHIIEAETEVVRCIRREGIGRRSEYLVGAKFHNLDEEVFAHLQTFVDEQLAKSGDGSMPAPRVKVEQPITIQYGRFDEFVNEVATNLSMTGMFIRAKKPRPPGSMLDFSFQLGDDFDLVHGKAEVVWTRPLPEGRDRPAGMGIRFTELDHVSRKVLEQILEKRLGQPDEGQGQGQGQREGEDSAPAGDSRTSELDAELEKVRQELEGELESARSELAQTKSKLQLAASALDEAMRQQTAAEDEARRLGTEAGPREDEINRLTGAAEGALGEVERLTAEVAGKESELASASTRIGDLERKLNTANTRAADLDRQLATTLDRVTELEADLGAASEQDGRLEELRGNLEGRLTEARQTREELEGRLAETEEARAELERQFAERDEARGQLEGRLAETEEARAELERRLAESDETRGQLEGRLAETEGAHAELERRLAESDETRGQLESRLAESDEERQRFRGELAEVESERVELGRRFDELTSEVQMLREERETLASLNREVEQARGELAEELERARHATTEQVENARNETVEQLRELSHGLEVAGNELDARERRIVELDQALAGSVPREELDKANAAREEAARQRDSLRASMSELQDEAEARTRQLQDRIVVLEADGEHLRQQLEGASTETKTMREEFERSEHDRRESAARAENLNYQVQELERETEALRSGHADELTSLRERAEQERRDGEAAVLELEHRLELAKQTEHELRTGLEQTTNARDELSNRTENLVQEAEDLRQEAAARDRELTDEIGGLEAQIRRLDDATGGLREELAARHVAADEQRVELEQAFRASSRLEVRLAEAAAVEQGVRQQVESLHGELQESRAHGDSLEAGLAQAAELESGLRQEIEDLKSALASAEDRRVALESELAETAATAERTAKENRELEIMRRSLIGNQERLEDKLASTSAELSTVPSIADHAPAKRSSARRSLRAAALVGFGLILGFIASYPFETLLVSADPMAIPISPPAVTESISNAAPESALEVEPSDRVEAAASLSEPAAASEPPAEPEPVRPSPEGAIERWAAAWSNQRAADYLASYATSFEVPEGFDRSSWELYRTERIESPSSIEVTLGEITIEISGPDSATATFEQSYAAGAHWDRVRKTLDLVWEGDAWRIARESSVELERS